MKKRSPRRALEKPRARRTKSKYQVEGKPRVDCHNPFYDNVARGRYNEIYKNKKVLDHKKTLTPYDFLLGHNNPKND